LIRSTFRPHWNETQRSKCAELSPRWGGGRLTPGLSWYSCLKRTERTRGPLNPQHGIEIVKKAITWPARQIAINAGEDGSVVVGKILEKDTYAYGYSASRPD
jgi:chaperonin GroEL (HSP60 family)